MSQKGGLVFSFRDPMRNDTLLDYILDRDTFTDSFSTQDVKIKKVNLAVLSFESDRICFAALAKKGRKVVTGKNSVRFTNFVELGEIALDDISGIIETHQYDRVKESFKRGADRLPPVTWEKVWDAIKKIKPEVAKKLKRLERLCETNQSHFSQKGYEIVATEKDAVGLCLDIFGDDRRQLSALWTPKDRDEPAPFLQCLEKAKIIEDIMIQHDHNVFGDWAINKRYQIAAVEFTKNDRKLTVINANRTSIEHTLGVDLVYYNHKYQSFVMVQYKRMDTDDDLESNKAIYRPIDSSYHTEIQRMQNCLDNMPKYSLKKILEFRLSHNPFFFKLCPKIIFEPLSDELIKGMYIPFDYWKVLVNAPETKGPRGGIQITYENTDRYFNNTSFVNLVKDGWIGSPVQAYDQLSKLISAGLEGNRSVIYAVEAENVDEN